MCTMQEQIAALEAQLAALESKSKEEKQALAQAESVIQAMRKMNTQTYQKKQVVQEIKELGLDNITFTGGD